MKKYELKKSVFGGNLHLVTPQRFLINYQHDLNQSQYEAVTSVNGPHLVITGAGTGKTRTIVYRVAYLVIIDLFCYSISEVNFNLFQKP